MVMMRDSIFAISAAARLFTCFCVTPFATQSRFDLRTPLTNTHHVFRWCKIAGAMHQLFYRRDRFPICPCTQSIKKAEKSRWYEGAMLVMSSVTFLFSVV